MGTFDALFPFRPPCIGTESWCGLGFVGLAGCSSTRGLVGLVLCLWSYVDIMAEMYLYRATNSASYQSKALPYYSTLSMSRQSWWLFIRPLT